LVSITISISIISVISLLPQLRLYSTSSAATGMSIGKSLVTTYVSTCYSICCLVISYTYNYYILSASHFSISIRLSIMVNIIKKLLMCLPKENWDSSCNHYKFAQS